MDFAFDQQTEDLRARLLEFMDSHVYPAEPAFAEIAQDGAAGSGWDPPAVLEDLKAEARRRGPWNLFYPEAAAGGGLPLLTYASLVEITGRSPMVAPEALNCSAPDTGNMELLHLFATPGQREQWLEPLLAGEIRSASCMTEPDVASSGASNLQMRIQRDGDDYVIDGCKWWSTGVMAQSCQLLVVVGLPRGDRRGPPAPHAQRLPPRRVTSRSLLRGRAAVRTHRTRPGSSAHRHHRAPMEPLRSHPGRARHRLGRATDLHLNRESTPTPRAPIVRRPKVPTPAPSTAHAARHERMLSDRRVVTALFDAALEDQRTEPVLRDTCHAPTRRARAPPWQCRGGFLGFRDGDASSGNDGNRRYRARRGPARVAERRLSMASRSAWSTVCGDCGDAWVESPGGGIAELI